jgi:hypothetical protein
MSDEMEEIRKNMVEQDGNVDLAYDSIRRKSRRSMPPEQWDDDLPKELHDSTVNMLKRIDENSINRLHCCYTQQTWATIMSELIDYFKMREIEFKVSHSELVIQYTVKQ